MNSLKIPNILMRLQAAATQKKMLFTIDERKKLSKNILTKIALAELYFGLEHFDEACSRFRLLSKQARITKYDQAALLIGEGYCNNMLMTTTDRKIRLKSIVATWGKALRLSKGTPLEKHALWMLGATMMTSTTTHLDALPYIAEFIRKYPSDVNVNSAYLSLAIINLSQNKIEDAVKIYRNLKGKNSESPQVKALERVFKLENIKTN